MFVVLVVDMLVYLSYKVVRQDFRYWMNLPNASSLVISFIVRVVLKIVTDFTGFLHARHPYEMGGSYWLFNMMLTHATVFGSIWLLEGALLGGDEDGGGGGNIATYYKIAQILSGVWACALVGLVAFSEREFVETFYSSRTGKQYCKELFKSGNHETMFCEIFDSHKSYWKGFEVELKEFLKENWDMWHMNRPEWFTDATKAMVPLYMIADKGGGGGVGGGGRSWWSCWSWRGGGANQKHRREEGPLHRGGRNRPRRVLPELPLNVRERGGRLRRLAEEVPRSAGLLLEKRILQALHP